MASLTVKNIPDELLRSLREAASRDRRSMTQEIVFLLESALSGGTRAAGAAIATRGDVNAQVAVWRALARKWQSDVDPLSEADELMNHRTTGRDVDFEAP